MGCRICFVLFMFCGGQWWVEVCAWKPPQQCLIGINIERQNRGDLSHGGENKGGDWLKRNEKQEGKKKQKIKKIRKKTVSYYKQAVVILRDVRG